MLSYQHHYHAGNHADVLKHWVLMECLTHLQKKDKPFDYIDTHAGAGLYRLNSAQAEKTGEAKAGVLQLDFGKLEELHPYRSAIEDDLARQQYPGSSLLVKRALRQGDKAWLFELHPQTIDELKTNCEQKRRSFVYQEDGFQGLLRLLPTASRRALVLIDPSYEVKDDYKTVVQVMTKAYQKMPQTLLLLWYPVVDRRRIEALEMDIKRSPMRNVHLFELGVEGDDGKGMTASGMVVVNPPWTLPQQIEANLPELARQLSQDGDLHYRQKVLIEE